MFLMGHGRFKCYDTNKLYFFLKKPLISKINIFFFIIIRDESSK